MEHDKIDQIINKHRGKPSSLIQILLEIQCENHWLSREVAEKVSKELNVPLNQIYHILTFYKAFSLIPKGRHQISICKGTACHVRGSPRVLDAVQELIKIGPGEIASDSKFSLETVNCLGCCAMGPVIVADGKYCGKMSVSKVKETLASYE